MYNYPANKKYDEFTPNEKCAYHSHNAEIALSQLNECIKDWTIPQEE